jgi:hypothetical protein
MRLKFVCPCGLENQTFGDWICHWKYGIPRKGAWYKRYPKLMAVVYFLNTKIVLETAYSDRYILGDLIAKFIKPSVSEHTDGEFISAGFFRRNGGWNYSEYLIPCSKKSAQKHFNHLY